VGGGVFGCCAAYELVKAGCRVTLVERDGIGTHASGRNPGNLNPLLATPPGLQALALASFRLHETLERELLELGCRSYGVEPVKRVMMCFEDSDEQDLETVAARFTQQPGFAAHWLDRKALHSLDPRLTQDVVSALLLEGSRSLDAYRFNHAVLEAAARLGATRLDAKVLDIARRDGGGYAVRTDKAELECDAAVLATGPWVAETKAWFGVDLPVKPVKGEMLRLRLPGADIACDFTHGLISLYKRGAGEVWVGVTRESCGFDERPSEAARKRLFDGAARIMPAIAGAEMIGQLASIRPMRDNGLPMIGKLLGGEEIFIANGGGIKGILTCTGVGRAIADMVLTGETHLPVSELALR
jgi:glycine oxidase